jgi:tRNA A37 N6-isopentenylltransferase MiaA
MVTANSSYLALVGPTCIGKTSYAHEFIREFPLELINVDSFQVYTFFRAGTGLADLQTERAHLYGFRNPHDILTPEEYLTFASGSLAKILSNDHYPLFEGGSISYIRALLQHYDLKLIGLRPHDDAHALELIEQRVAATETTEELLMTEIAAGLEAGYRDTIIMRDDVVYLPYVEYLEGRISRADARGRVRKNLLQRYQTQMAEYKTLPVEWFIPAEGTLLEMRKLIARFLNIQSS